MAVEYAAIVLAPELAAHGAFGCLLEEKLGGKAVLNHSLDCFDEDPACTVTYVCAQGAIFDWINGNPLAFASPKMKLLKAGAGAQQALRDALGKAATELVAVHDALFPNFGPDLLAKLLSVAVGHGAAAPAWHMDGALGRLAPLDTAGQPVASTVLGPKAERRTGMLELPGNAAGLQMLQSPQFFPRQALLDALAKAPAPLECFAGTALTYRAAGQAVCLVKGRLENLRLDSEDELRVMQKLLSTGPKKKEKYTGLGW
jgi:2-C-methyl-D-erythritol 4-phosphate cytidylyltransferase